MQSVLIVDDDTAIRLTMRYILEDAGYTIYEASDGESALQRLRESPERLVVLLDLRMPGMDGQQMLEAVAAAHDTHATRHVYVLLTANACSLTPELETLLTQLSIPVVAKPCGLDCLLETVAQATARVDSGRIAS